MLHWHMTFDWYGNLWEFWKKGVKVAKLSLVQKLFKCESYIWEKNSTGPEGSSRKLPFSSFVLWWMINKENRRKILLKIPFTTLREQNKVCKTGYSSATQRGKIILSAFVHSLILSVMIQRLNVDWPANRDLPFPAQFPLLHNRLV